MNVLVKSAITVVVGSFIAARLIWPTLNIDELTFGLLILAALPWFAPVIKSLKWGNVEITTRDMRVAGEKVTQTVKLRGTAGYASDKLAADAEASAERIQAVTAMVADALKNIQSFSAKEDPNLALISLRYEVEKRLRELAVIVGIDPDQTLVKLLGNFDREEVIALSVYSGLREIVVAGNQAAHGARVEPGLAGWVATNGREVLAALDVILQEHKSQNEPKTS